jgi:threonine aldolase
MHLDGARLFNALVAKKEDPKIYGALFDTVSICLSKGLGTPLGTVLVGKKEIMKNAIRVRKVLGGGMRQIGYMAAAGLYALDHHVVRLEEDHRKAKELATVLEAQTYVDSVEPTETNIVIFYLSDRISEEKFITDLQQLNIKISSMGQGKLRIVTHLDYTHDMHQRVMNVLTSY